MIATALSIYFLICAAAILAVGTRLARGRNLADGDFAEFRLSAFGADITPERPATSPDSLDWRGDTFQAVAR